MLQYLPLCLIVITLFLFRNYATYITCFIVALIFNNITNILLKILIKQPRPNDEDRAINLGILYGIPVGYDKFGMPSGHAQNCAFITFYTIAVLRDFVISVAYILITIVVCIQRYTDKKHSIEQIAVGLIVGTFIGIATYYYCKNMLVGNKNHKPDDDAPSMHNVI